MRTVALALLIIAGLLGFVAPCGAQDVPRVPPPQQPLGVRQFQSGFAQRFADQHARDRNRNQILYFIAGVVVPVIVAVFHRASDENQYDTTDNIVYFAGCVVAVVVGYMFFFVF